MIFNIFKHSCITFTIIVLIKQSYCVSHDSEIGNCSNVGWDRSIPMFSTNIHKPNNRWFSTFRKTDYTVRFPEVIFFANSLSVL